MNVRGLVPRILLSTLVALAGCQQKAIAPPSNEPPPAPPQTASAPPAAPPPSPSPVTSASESPPPQPPEDAPDLAGGPCEYAEQPGSCVPRADGTFTFSGAIDGKQMQLDKNTLDPGSKRLPAGKAVACTLKLSTTGTCPPCRFSIGSCGDAALDVLRSRLPKR